MSDLFAVLDGDASQASPIVVVTHSCVPRGKGRPRGRIMKGPKGLFVSFYTDPETRAYEAEIAGAARKAMRGNKPFEGPLAIRVFIMMPVPPSWTARDRAAALAGTKFPTNSSDTDNCAKAVLDAMNEIVWLDDRQIVRLFAIKEFATAPGIIAEVYRLP